MFKFNFYFSYIYVKYLGSRLITSDRQSYYECNNVIFNYAMMKFDIGKTFKSFNRVIPS